MIPGADTAQKLMGRGPRKIGWGGVIFLRLGYPAISMNLKTESFTYVILLINRKYMFFFYTFGD